MLHYYLRRIRHKLAPYQGTDTAVHHYTLWGESFEMEDFRAWYALDTVFKELRQDCYGLRKIRFQPSDVVIDIGGHVGFFSILLGRLFPEIQIYAFEPVQENYQHFLSNLKRNRIENVTLQQLAVTQDGRALELYVHPLNTGGGLNEQLVRQQDFSQHRCYQVPSIQLDEIFSRHQIAACRLLKINCEGSEYEILFHARSLPNIEYLDKCLSA